MMKNYTIIRKVLALFLVFNLLSAPAWSHISALEKARTQMQKDTEALSKYEDYSLSETMKRVAWLVGGMTGASATAGAGYSIYKYVQSTKKSKLEKETLSRVMDLMVSLDKASQGLKPGEMFEAGKLGERGLELFNLRVQQLKDAHVWSFPREFEISGKKWHVKSGQEAAFLERISPKYYQYLDDFIVTEKTLLPAGMTTVDIRFMQQVDKKFLEEVLGPQLKHLRHFCEPVGQRVAVQSSKASIGKMGRWLLGNGKWYVIGATALLWLGADMSAFSGQEEQAWLSRIEQNPALLLQVTDEAFARISFSDRLSEYYLAVADFTHELALLSDEHFEVLMTQQNLEQRQEKETQARLEHILRVAR